MLTLTHGSGAGVVAMHAYQSYVWVLTGMAGVPGLWRMDTSEQSLSVGLTDVTYAGYSNSTSFVIAGNYIYILCQNGSGYPTILKVKMSNQSLVANVTLGAGYSAPGMIHTDGTYLYITCLNGAQVVACSKFYAYPTADTTPALINTATYNASTNIGSGAFTSAFNGTYVGYMLNRAGADSRLIVFDVAAGTSGTVGAGAVGATISTARGGLICSDGGYFYIGWYAVASTWYVYGYYRTVPGAWAVGPGTQTAFVSGDATPWGIWVDETKVTLNGYNSGSGNIMPAAVVPKDCLSPGSGGLTGIARTGDATYMYVADDQSSTNFYRMAK